MAMRQERETEAGTGWSPIGGGYSLGGSPGGGTGPGMGDNMPDPYAPAGPSYTGSGNYIIPRTDANGNFGQLPRGTPIPNPNASSWTPPPSLGGGPYQPPPFGYPGMDGQMSQISQFIQQSQNRPTPQSAAGVLGPQQMAGQSDLRGRQMGVMDQLNGWMNGQNSLAQMQGQRQLGNAIAQQRSMAAGAKPGMGAMAQRLAAQNSGQLSADIGARTNEAMIQERMGAASALGGLATNARGQDEQLGMFNAGEGNRMNMFGADLGQRNNQFNAGMQRDMYGLNDQAWNSGMTQGLGRSRLGLDSQLGLGELGLRKDLGYADIQGRKDVAGISAEAMKSAQPSTLERYIGMGLGAVTGAVGLAGNLGWKPFGQ